jgi:hypothetical protein
MVSVKEIQEKSSTKRYGYEKFLDYFAAWVVKLLLPLGVTATQISFFWVIVQFLAPLLFLQATHTYFIVAIVLFQLMFVFDLSDGKIFRFQTSSKPRLKPLFPKYLDRLGHFINNAWLFICLGFGIALRFGDVLYIAYGLITAIFYLLNKAITVNSTWYKSTEERETISHLVSGTSVRGGSQFKQLLFDVLRVEHLFGLLFFGIVFDLPQMTLLFYLVFFALEFIRKLIAQSQALWKEDKRRV